MANEQNLKPCEYKFTQEDAKKGQQRSAEVRRERASLRKSLQNVLNSDIRITKGSLYDTYLAMGIDISKYSLGELAGMGLLFGALNGNATNFKTMMETNNEITEENSVSVPTLKIEINDNSKLEGVMYEEDRHNEDDNRQ